MFAFAGGENDLLVRVVGNPFETPKSALNESLTQTLSASYPSPKTHFVTEPNATSRPGYRWIIVFDPSPMVYGPTLCDANINDPALTVASPGQTTIRLMAVFCAKRRTMSQVDASFAKTATPSDPVATRAFARIGLLLAPSYDQYRIKRCPTPAAC